MRRPLLVLALLALTGCGLDQPYPGKSYYVLEAAARDGTPASGVATRAIRVSRASVAPPFSSRALQYKVASSRFEPSYYHNWADDPGALVSKVARETLAASGAFLVVAAGSDAAEAEVLEMQVSALYVDVTGPRPAVVLALQATLLDDGGVIRLARELERTERIDAADAPEAVRGLNTALGSILVELRAEITDGPS